MGRLIFALLLLSVLCTSAGAQTNNSGFTETQRKAHLERRADSTTWDKEMLQGDIGYISEMRAIGPFPAGVFPVPDYELLGPGSFRGVFSKGTGYRPDTINGKLVVTTSFGVGKNSLNAPRYGGDEKQIFFTIVTVVDTLNEEGGAIGLSLISSRNNPDFVGEGEFLTTTGKISYTAFITAENERFALVNMRLFNLKYGSVIVVVGQPDGSFRSLQLGEGELEAAAAEQYLREVVLKDREVLKLIGG